MNFIKKNGEVLRFLDISTREYVLSIIYSCLSSITFVTVVYLLKQILDSLSQTIGMTTYSYLFVCCLLVILNIFFIRQSMFYKVLTKQRGLKVTQRRLFKSLSTKPYFSIEKLGMGKWLTMIGPDSVDVSNLTSETHTNFFSGLAKFLFTLVISVTINWKLAVFILLISAFSVIIPTYFSKLIKQTKDIKRGNDSELRNFVVEVLHNKNSIRLYKAYKFVLAKFNSQN
ncbi:hypothetical protein BAU15_00600 [Enterococcus sp. JM4C]|uniref:ABC transporter ATP-binding protein n=1 Tax=Candidatus Enterococcus huntleyi TaxID=1857217 RepID=UPI00137B8833|nr:ABC transporter ATP-binding protein [Enterococcus sp. JM4C]KAF1299179.1 hypothetical protein BAU15_00600 [Enterococcus sp. JM4C]